MKRGLAVVMALLVAGCAASGASPSLPAGTPAGGTPSVPSSTASHTATPEPPARLQIPGSGSLGIFDPAPAVDPDGKRIWMSYSSVDPSKWPANKRISTRIAHSDNYGATWTDDGVVNQSTDVTLPLAAPNNAGTWQHEVSRLAYDPFAPANERWILVWMRYIEVNGVRHFDHTWIAMRTAPSPLPGKWSAERKLFVAAGYPSSDDSIVGPPQYRLNALASDLVGCVAATEPGLLVYPEALYMSLYCATPNVTDGRQILLRQPRNGGKWTYVGSLTTNADARAMGYDDFSATELADTSKGPYLIVSPEKGGRYKGCLAFEIADLASASVVRRNGAPVVAKKIELNLGGMGFGGACGYSPALSPRLLYSELFSAVPPFRIFETTVDLSGG